MQTKEINALVLKKNIAANKKTSENIIKPLSILTIMPKESWGVSLGHTFFY